MNSLQNKILNKTGHILTYGITPPKSTNTEERINEIAQIHINRIKELNIDALAIYDIQDESDRTKQERTFEFISTIDPSRYANHYLKSLNIDKIIYRCVGNYQKEHMINWLNSGTDRFSVFVGTSSSNENISLSLGECYNYAAQSQNTLLVGGVTIPERHSKKNDEHLRLENKVKNGCEYFISQCVYDVSISKKFLYDYKTHFENNNLDIKPIIFTLTPCGSTKTLEFIKWLGIRIPTWVENKLCKAEDMLQISLDLIKIFYHELYSYANEMGIPIGCNVESVSVRREEILAAIELCKYMDRIYS